MNKQQEQVLEFHKKYGCPINKRPTIVDNQELLLRARLIVEEASEFLVAASKGDLVGMTDAMIDILYVVNGAGVVLGVDLEEPFDEVHRSNMTKDGSDKDSGGKVAKGPNFVKPNIEECIWRQINPQSSGGV